MVVAETRIPSFASSPWIRTQPHRGSPGRASGSTRRRPDRVAAAPRSASFCRSTSAAPARGATGGAWGAHHERGPSRTGEHPARRGEHHLCRAGGGEGGPPDASGPSAGDEGPGSRRPLTDLVRPGAHREAEESTQHEIEQGEQHESSPFRSTGRVMLRRGLVRDPIARFRAPSGELISEYAHRRPLGRALRVRGRDDASSVEIKLSPRVRRSIGGGTARCRRREVVSILADKDDQAVSVLWQER